MGGAKSKTAGVDAAAFRAELDVISRLGESDDSENDEQCLHCFKIFAEDADTFALARFCDVLTAVGDPRNRAAQKLTFETLDGDQDGFVDLVEFSTYIRSTKAQREPFGLFVLRDDSVTLPTSKSRQDFFNAALEQVSEKPVDETIHALFTCFASTKRISWAQFKATLGAAGDHRSEETLWDLFTAIDRGEDSFIDEREFHAWVHKHPEAPFHAKHVPKSP
ncbi:hypothetical protein M885DRAFT_516187 [Pelagophyceae sp. CCMP2097]|nr:hypothetical protein M885DRAFT_516187 [Pelagophyceae sp. CCMP2097]